MLLLVAPLILLHRQRRPHAAADFGFLFVFCPSPLLYRTPLLLLVLCLRFPSECVLLFSLLLLFPHGAAAATVRTIPSIAFHFLLMLRCSSLDEDRSFPFPLSRAAEVDDSNRLHNLSSNPMISHSTAAALSFTYQLSKKKNTITNTRFLSAAICEGTRITEFAIFKEMFSHCCTRFQSDRIETQEKNQSPIRNFLLTDASEANQNTHIK